MNKLKTYGLLILSLVFTVIGHFKVSASVQPNGVESFVNPSVLLSVSNGILFGGIIFFLGIGILTYSLYSFVKEQ